MKRHCYAILMAFAALLLAACTPNPFVIEQVNSHVFASPQPKTPAQWQQLAAKLGPGGVIVKLDSATEGSDEGAAQVGLVDVDLHIEPQGDGPIYAQVEGVLTRPDPVKVAVAVSIVCSPTLMVDVHCIHGWDRTHYIIARAQVECGGMSPEQAHEQWHRAAHYFPYGDRIPSPGLEADWREFVEQWRARGSPAKAVALTATAATVLEAVGR